MEHLELEDAVLVGFSMGSGEVTRYLGKYGSARVRKGVLFGAIPPFLLKTDDNPEGVDAQVFEDIKAAVVKDRYAYSKDFFDNFYNVDKLAPDRISEQAWQASFNVAAGSSPYASYACVATWLTDFRADLPNIDVPMLVVHGTEDRILPYESTAQRLPDLVADLRLVPVEGGPHNIGWTHPEECNKALLEFLAEDAGGSSRLERDLATAASRKR
jgi:non-heme chloroperoxidase